jgi:cytochrome c biogenesis protein CcdA
MRGAQKIQTALFAEKTTQGLPAKNNISDLSEAKLQKLYFIIRTAIMSVLGAVITFFYISFFGKIGVFLGILLGVIIFIIGLIVTRLFDAQITKLTKYIVRRLGNHKKIRDFIINHF